MTGRSEPLSGATATDVERFLARLLETGVPCWVENGNLRLRGKSGQVSDGDLAYLSRHKRELLAYLTERHIDSPGYALAENASAAWLHSLLFPHSSTYRIGGICRLGPEVEIESLRGAFKHLLERHPVLRSTLQQRFGLLTAVPRPWSISHGSEPLTVIDARGWSRQELESFWTRALRGDAPGGGAPLFDCTALLVRQDAISYLATLRSRQSTRESFADESSGYVLLFTAHHAAMDFLSFNFLLQELEELYRRASSEPATWREEAEDGSLWEFAAQEQRWLKSPEARETLAHWRNVLLPPPPLVNLGRARVKSEPEEESTEFRVLLGEQAVQEVVKCAASLRVTPYVVMLSAFQVLLRLHSGCQDLCLASPVHGRPGARWRKAIGYFANVVVWRQRINPHASFQDLIARNRELLAAAQKEEQPPFPWLLRELKREGATPLDSLARIAFVQDTVVYKSRGYFQILHVEQGGTIYDLVATLHAAGESWVMSYRYRPDMVDRELIEALASRFEEVLRSLLRDPTMPLHQTALLEPPGWHRTGSLGSLPPNFLVSAIAGWARSAPANIALRDAGRMLTYSDLEEQTERIARGLARRTARQRPVALLAERGIDSILLLLALLKLRIPYVPLNPEQPDARLASMLEHAQPQLVVCSQKLHTRMQGITGRPLATLETLCQPSPADAVEAASTTLCPHSDADLAYIIFTSGSTGRPKGVAVSYGQLHHLLASTRFCFELPGQLWSLFHHLSFDFSVWELWGPLVYGHALTVLSEQEIHSPVALLITLRKDRITHLALTPPACELLASVLEREDPRELSVRTVFLGGAPLADTLAERLQRWGWDVWNFYGPTETTVWSTCCRLDDEQPRVRIGFPLPGLHVYILNEDLQWTPEHTLGELYIGGPQVAQYFEAAAATAAQFVPDPWSEGGRVYRTGDQVRYSARRGLEFVGRRDRQIKFRGHRVELGDLEEAIRRLPLVREAALLLVSASRLVCFYASVNGQELNPAVLDRASRAVLPQYVCPVEFVWLRSLPLSQNHKVDLRALEGLAAQSLPRQPSVSASAPQELLARIAAVWHEVLGIETADVHAPFFDSGGTSLMLLKLQERLSSELACELPLVDLYAYPTVAALADFLSTRRATPGRTSCVDL